MNPQDNVTPSADSLAREAKKAAKKGGLPPVHLWNPPFCGDLDIRIKRDGTWFYLGTPIGRGQLLRLFSTFMKREGEDCLARNVDAVLSAIRQKYAQYGIDKPPFVVIKSESGTYGMAVMTAHSVDEVRELNRKQRTHMSKTKEGQAVSKVIIQEGVYTFETWGEANAVAEPVVYMIDHFVVGGFYRVHTGRGPNENLNAPGMHFEPLAFAEPCNMPDCAEFPDAGVNRFYAYGVIARLALLAAAREIRALG